MFIGTYWYIHQEEYSLFNARPINILRTSEVPAPISYNLASLKNLPVGKSLIYPFPPTKTRLIYILYGNHN